MGDVAFQRQEQDRPGTPGSRKKADCVRTVTSGGTGKVDRVGTGHRKPCFPT